ncbi:MAG TPA: DUF952 domain-containing protein [Lacibacter sp.]|nr:DUF952 domain-containing protein [Lacibacter sp.]HMO89055.1 DUF952 domain-containing protein [Lacibacter sp.]HMP87223.1 DUF952 domain-containing protein [Lacibacter sp.]
MSLIYHITTAAAWKDALNSGFYETESLTTEGFIHCSQEEQVPGVLERYYSGNKNLVLLVIETEKLISRFVFEWSPSTADTFPHIYGPLNTDAVIDVRPVSAASATTD